MRRFRLVQKIWSVFILPEKKNAVCSWKVSNMELFVTLLCELFRHAPGFFILDYIVLYTVCTLCRSHRFQGSEWLHIFSICRHQRWATPPVFFIVQSHQYTKVLTPILDKFAVLIFNNQIILNSRYITQRLKNVKNSLYENRGKDD